MPARHPQRAAGRSRRTTTISADRERLPTARRAARRDGRREQRAAAHDRARAAAVGDPPDDRAERRPRRAPPRGTPRRCPSALAPTSSRRSGTSVSATPNASDGSERQPRRRRATRGRAAASPAARRRACAGSGRGWASASGREDDPERRDGEEDDLAPDALGRHADHRAELRRRRSPRRSTTPSASPRRSRGAALTDPRQAAPSTSSAPPTPCAKRARSSDDADVARTRTRRRTPSSARSPPTTVARGAVRARPSQPPGSAPRERPDRVRGDQHAGLRPSSGRTRRSSVGQQRRERRVEHRVDEDDRADQQRPAGARR